MLSVLEQPEIRRQACPITVEGYHEMGRLGLLDENVELLEGVIVYKISKSALHETLVEYLRRLLEALLLQGMFIGKERPITCSHSEPEPDLAVFAGNWKNYRHTHPNTAELVIEVAVSTLAKDQFKAACYAGAGVKEYWLVDADAKQIILMRDPIGDEYTSSITVAIGQMATSSIIPQLSVNVTELFAE